MSVKLYADGEKETLGTDNGEIDFFQSKNGNNET